MLNFLRSRLLICLSLVFPAAAVYAAPPAPGVVIQNRAEAIYMNARLGLLERVFSNTVEAVVNEFPAIEVDADQTVLVSPGVVSQYVFFVENIGNVDLNPQINVAQQAGDDFDVNTIDVFRDVNGNGTIDPGEPQISLGDSVQLAPGDRTSFVVRFQSPNGVSDGNRSLIDFVANDPARNVSNQSVGTAIVSEGGLIVYKDASKTEVTSGETLSYTISLRNNGAGDIQPFSTLESVPLTIDGVARQGVIFRDDIPLHTRFESIDETVTFRAVFHDVSEPDKHTYTTSAPVDPAQIQAIAFVYDPDSDLSTADAYPAGFSTDVQFSVRVNDNASGLKVENEAEAYQPVGVGDPVPFLSNNVETPIIGPAGDIRFTDSTFTADVGSIPTNTNTFLEINAGLCNLDPGAAETVQITITARPENDREVVPATETAPNSGVFRTAAIPVQDQEPAVQSNGILTGLKNTIAQAAAVCQGQTLTDDLVINAGGFVFHALNNSPVPNATVILFDGAGTEVDRVTTDADGFYQFTNVAAGSYRLDVTNPGGLTFASSRTLFPGFDRNVDPLASYGNTFTLANALGTYGVDVPLDPGGGNLTLSLIKTADKDRAEYGDFVRYEVKVTNNSSGGRVNVKINDTLPGGFSYVVGTSRLNGQQLTDPIGAPGPQLLYDLEDYDLPPSESHSLSYIVRVLPTAGKGKLCNFARADGMLVGVGTRANSNVDRHCVKVEKSGVFADEATVVGKVWLDVNGNGVQDTYTPGDVGVDDGQRGDPATGGLPAPYLLGRGLCSQATQVTPCDDVHTGGMERIEPGIPGARIYLQNGLSVITDENGLYSFAGLRPVTHVFVIDRSTLPEGTRIARTHARDALAPGSRFVDVKKGELRVENFPVGPGSRQTLTALKDRIKNFEGLRVDESLLRADLPLTRAEVRPSATSRQGELLTRTQKTKSRSWKPTVSGRLPQLPETKDIARTVDLEAIAPTLSPQLGFLDLENRDTISRNRISVRVKGPAAGALALNINGKRINASQIGQRAIYRAGGVQTAEFVAVSLSAGANELEVVQTDPFGNDRGRRSILVFAPGQPTKIHVAVPSTGIANPATPLPVVVRVTDADGRLTGTPMEVTLKATRGHFDVTDIRDTEPGTQVYIDRGEAIFHYIPPALAGSHRITVRSALGTHTADVQLTPDLKQSLAAGIIEGAVRFGKGGSSLAPLIEKDELSSFEETVEGVRGALYLKGKIKGDALLTLRYQSDRDAEDRLFRDINPDDFYPVYGDNSERGFDAQSNSELFVKVEKGLSYVLYGDIQVAPQSDAVKLGAYSRAVTGSYVHVEQSGVRVDLFAARTTQNQVIREIPARGVSGPYQVDLGDFKEGSERVEIVTFDRDQPEVEVRVLPQRRFTDYTIDFFANSILFDRPVPSVDDDFNPQVIRITYEVEEDGDNYWIVGGEVGVDVTDNVTIGYRETRSLADKRFDDKRTVRSGYAQLDAGRLGKAEVEIAQTENNLGRRGKGARAQYEARNNIGRIRVGGAQTDETFDAPRASVGEGRREANIEADVRVTDGVSVEGEGLYTQDRKTRDTRYGAEGRAKIRANSQVEVIAGARHVVTDRAAQSERTKVSSGIVGVDVHPEALPGAKAGIEYEQDIRDSGNRRWLVDGGYQVSEFLRLYGKAEISPSGSGEFGLGDINSDRLTSIAGVEIIWTDTTRSFTEHREGTRGGLANGIAWNWIYADWHKFYAKFEHVQPIKQDHKQNAAISLGYTYENEGKTQLFETQSEWNLQDDYADNWYASLAYGQRFGDITLLAQNRMALTSEDGGERTRDRLRAGFAYRPLHGSSLATLGWYGIEFDENEAVNSHAIIHTWAFAAEHDFLRDVSFKARHAGRYQDQRYAELDAESLVVLGSAGIEWDITDTLVIGVNGTVFADPIANATTSGLGGEIGFVPIENVIISLGYNWAEIEEEKIRDIYQKGFYVRLRAKMDEDVWNVFDGVGLSGE